jgi:hypothetical protein
MKSSRCGFRTLTMTSRTKSWPDVRREPIAVSADQVYGMFLVCVRYRAGKRLFEQAPSVRSEGR